MWEGVKHALHQSKQPLSLHPYDRQLIKKKIILLRVCYSLGTNILRLLLFYKLEQSTGLNKLNKNHSNNKTITLNT